MKAFYIQVQNAKLNSYWYANKLGQCFWATRHENLIDEGFSYRLLPEGVDIDTTGRYFEGKDVIVIKEANVKIVSVTQVIEL